jgi:hypothetical protein
LLRHLSLLHRAPYVCAAPAACCLDRNTRRGRGFGDAKATCAGPGRGSRRASWCDCRQIRCVRPSRCSTTRPSACHCRLHRVRYGEPRDPYPPWSWLDRPRNDSAAYSGNPPRADNLPGRTATAPQSSWHIH